MYIVRRHHVLIQKPGGVGERVWREKLPLCVRVYLLYNRALCITP